VEAFAKRDPDETFLQQVVAKLPWFHHCILLDKLKNDQKRLWYVQQIIEHGWSRKEIGENIGQT